MVDPEGEAVDAMIEGQEKLAEELAARSLITDVDVRDAYGKMARPDSRQISRRHRRKNRD